jgi:hypothetical protein
MVAAYLRGLLKPEPQYGLRSSLSEDTIYEGMSALMQMEGHRMSIEVDAAILSCLDDKSKKSTLSAISARMGRCSELRSMDIYKLDQVKQVTQNKNELSLYQLYHIAKKCGILDAISEASEDQTDE